MIARVHEFGKGKDLVFVTSYDILKEIQLKSKTILGAKRECSKIDTGKNVLCIYDGEEIVALRKGGKWIPLDSII